MVHSQCICIGVEVVEVAGGTNQVGTEDSCESNDSRRNGRYRVIERGGERDS